MKLRKQILVLLFTLYTTAQSHSISHRQNFGPNPPSLHEHRVNPNADNLFESFGQSSSIYLTEKSSKNPKDIAVDFLVTKTGIAPNEIKIKSFYQSTHTGVWHVHVVQFVDGVEVVNGVANVNIDASGRVVSYGNSFYSPSDANSPNTLYQAPQILLNRIQNKFTKSNSWKKSVSSSKVNLSPADAVSSLAKLLNLEESAVPYEVVPVNSIRGDDSEGYKVKGVGFAVNDVNARLKWINMGNEVKLSWDLEVEMNNNWYHAIVDASSGDVHQLVDWVSDASYNVYPLGVNDPESGSRKIVVDPANKIASPLGWHDQARGKKFTVTAGNNVYAQENHDNRYEWENNRRPVSSTLDFDFPIDFKKEPKTYEAAAVTNLFYWCNSIHDLFYIYGFDEQAGNFQVENFGRGGRDGDPVIAHAQDGSGYNNANFATPPDGSPGRMRMYQWTETSPMRDGDLEGGIIMHEYAHGISIRLTGGPADSSCLGWGESGGMGEGWGDFFATILRMDSNTTSKDTFGMGEYSNGGEGIRRYKYSTSKSVNPSIYSFTQKPGYWGVHAKGEVWAEILFDVYWDMVEKWGFNPNWYETGYEGVEPIIPEVVKAFESKSWIAKLHSHYRDNENGEWVPKSTKDRRSHRKLKFEKNKSTKGKSPRKPHKGGNVKMLQLVVDGLKLQPCRPSFVDARDAIILADKLAFEGENFCLLWKGFARRGLGTDAESGGEDGFKVPKVCRE